MLLLETTVKDSIEKKDVVPDKTEKVKTAKQIQKDMEKWAKQLNQKKDVKPNAAGSAKANVQSLLEPRHSATADVAFSALEKNVICFKRRHDEKCVFFCIINISWRLARSVRV